VRKVRNTWGVKLLNDPSRLELKTLLLLLKMSPIKRLIPNSIKQEAKFFLQYLLKIRYNRYELPLEIEDWVSKSKAITFVDIGAFRGDFSYALSNTFQVSKGILIEPIASQIPVLTSRFPDERRFTVLNLAVSNNNGEAEFYFVDELHVMSSMFKIKGEFYEPFLITSPGTEIKVPTETLDSIVTRHHLGVLDLLKIDVQGSEHLVLEGGLETLKRTKIVYVEVSYRPMYEGSASFFDIYNFMNDKNFRFGGATPACNVNGEITQADALFINNALCP
jgi:FkbM family methyltransferase